VSPVAGKSGTGETPVLRLLHHSFREAHERGFEVDFFFFQQGQLISGRDELARDKRVILDAALERHFEVTVVRSDGFNIRALAQESGGLLLSLGDANVKYHTDARLADDVGDRARVQQLALFDDTNRVTQVGQLRKNVRRDQDGLAHPAELFEQLA